MGKGSGKTCEREAIPLLAVGSEREQLENQVLGSEWKYRIAVEALEAHPDWNALQGRLSKLQEPVVVKPSKAQKELDKQLRLAIIRKGAASDEVKALRAEKAGMEIPAEDNSEMEAQLEKEAKALQKKLIGSEKKKSGERFFTGGSIDLKALYHREQKNAELEVEIRMLERQSAAKHKQAAAKAAKQGPKKIKKSESYQALVPQNIFGNSAVSATHEAPKEWLVTDDGDVIFMGTPDQLKTRKNKAGDHLGLPFSAVKPFGKPSYGVRYWSIDAQGRIKPPIGGNQSWAPGINGSFCNTDGCKLDNCSCGLYAFKYEGGAKICDSTYFDPKTATVPNREDTVIGVCAMWDVRHAWGSAVRSRFAAPVSFSLPTKVGKQQKALIEKAAKLYGVELVKPTELGKEGDRFLAQELPKFA